MNLGSLVASNALDVGHSTGHVIEVGLVSLFGLGTLPVGERVGQDVLDHGLVRAVGGEQVIGSAVGELVPAVGSTNDEVGEMLLDGANVLVQLGTGQVATVEGLRADGDGLDDILVTGNGVLDRVEVLEEGGVLGCHVALVLGADPNNHEFGQYHVNQDLWTVGLHLPHTKNDLEVLLLCSRKDVLSAVTFGGGVGADQLGQVLQVVKVILVVLGGLAGAIGVLVAEGEAQSATSRNDRRSSGQKEGQKARNTHDEGCGGRL